MEGLTAKQQEIFDFICEMRLVQGISPTHREICSRFGLKSPNSSMQHIAVMRKKGYLRDAGHRARCIVPINTATLAERSKEMYLVCRAIAEMVPRKELCDPSFWPIVEKAKAAIEGVQA